MVPMPKNKDDEREEGEIFVKMIQAMRR